MKLLKCFMGDCQGGFNYIRRLFANLEKKLHFVYRNTFIMKRSTYTISLNAGKKFKIIYFENLLPIFANQEKLHLRLDEILCSRVHHFFIC